MKRSTLGWIEIILAIVMICLGIYTLLNPANALLDIVIVYAIVAILTGIADFVLYFRLERRGGFASGMMIVSGILNILVGVLLLFNIQEGAWALSILFPIWFIFYCFAHLMNIDWVKVNGSSFEYWMSLIANVIGIVLGFLLLLNPFASAASLVYFVGFYLLLIGFTNLVTGIGNVGKAY